MRNHSTKNLILALWLSLIILLNSYYTDISVDSPIQQSTNTLTTVQSAQPLSGDFYLSDVPKYDGSPYVVLNNNAPYFDDVEMTSVAFEQYSPLDSFGRCGTAVASVGVEIMPTEDRESISHIEPTAWQSVKYDDIEGDYLFNRCHLLGFQLSGENANELNLITGTRSMNVDGMLPFENIIADYVETTENHVYYRVTPIFEGDNLLASGVVMEAKSVEDNGEGVQFNVFCYNVQDGIIIDYATGNSHTLENPSTSQIYHNETQYILNTDSKKIHLPSCRYVAQMSEDNMQETTNAIDELIAKGYEPCKVCTP